MGIRDRIKGMGLELRDPAAIERDRLEAEARAALPRPATSYPLWHILFVVPCVLFGLMFLGNNAPDRWIPYELFRNLGVLIFLVVHFDFRPRRSEITLPNRPQVFEKLGRPRRVVYNRIDKHGRAPIHHHLYSADHRHTRGCKLLAIKFKCKKRSSAKSTHCAGFGDGRTNHSSRQSMRKGHQLPTHVATRTHTRTRKRG